MIRRVAGSGLLCAALVLASTAFGAEKPAVNEEPFKNLATYKVGENAGNAQAVANTAIEALNNPEIRPAVEKLLLGVLADPKATADAKSFVCRQLRIMGTAASVPALAALLTDEKLSHMGRYALGRMACPEAGKALRDALGKVKGKLLVGVINTVGERREPEGAAPVIALLKNADPEVAIAAARALGKICGDAAVAALAAARKGASDKMLQTVEDAWLRCADQYLAAGEKDKAKAIYEPLYAPTEKANIRAAALRGLIALGGDQAIALILKPLKSNDLAMQAIAVSYIRDVPGTEATKAFAAELPKLSPAAQVLVIGALASRGDAAAGPAVTAAAKSQDPAVRVAALEALAAVGDATNVPLLVKSAASQEKAEADAARSTLTRLAGDGVDAALLAEMKKADAAGRAELIKTLTARRAEGVVPQLLKFAAEDPDEGVRKEAFTAIGKLADEKTLPAIVDLMLAAKGDEALKAAERAVITVARNIESDAAREAALLVGLPKAKGAAKATLLRVHGRFGGEKSLAAVRSALGDADAAIKDAAIRALAEWPDASPADDLLKLVQTTDNQVHRVLALRGYVRLLALPSGRPITEVLQRYDEAMKLATRPDDKKLVLAAMAELRHPAVLRAIGPYLTVPELKAEAEAAMKKVTEAMKAPAKLSASANPDKVGNAADGKPDTRWDTGGAQSGGEWFMIELPVEQTITKLTLDTRGSGGDYPRGYEIYISRDGQSWGQPIVKGEGKGAVTEIPLPPTFGRFVKIVQTGKSEGLFWSIHELKLETKPIEIK